MRKRPHSIRPRSGPDTGTPVDAGVGHGRAGFTLLEMMVALVLASLLLGWSVPRLRSKLDRWAVLGARETLVSIVGSARATALVRGEGWVQIDAATGAVAWGSGPDSLGLNDLSDEWGVRVLDGPGVGTPVRFDDLGRGQLASRTFTLVRGGATGGVSLSSYGRVRRW